jgi:hypothetical protein
MTIPNPKAAVEKFFVGGDAGGATDFLLEVTRFVTMQVSTYFISNFSNLAM